MKIKKGDERTNERTNLVTESLLELLIAAKNVSLYERTSKLLSNLTPAQNQSKEGPHTQNDPRINKD